MSCKHAKLNANARQTTVSSNLTELVETFLDSLFGGGSRSVLFFVFRVLLDVSTILLYLQNWNEHFWRWMLGRQEKITGQVQQVLVALPLFAFGSRPRDPIAAVHYTNKESWNINDYKVMYGSDFTVRYMSCQMKLGQLTVIRYTVSCALLRCLIWVIPDPDLQS